MRFPTLTSLLCLLACTKNAPGDSPANGHAPDTPTAGPQLVGEAVARLPEGSNARLVRVLELTTDRPARVTVTFDDGVREKTVAFDALATEHSLPLLGFAADATTALDLVLTGEDGAVTELLDHLEVVTDPLPDKFPIIELVSARVDRMEPGYTMFPVKTADDSYVVVVDEVGTVVWFYESERFWEDAFVLSDGRVFGLEEGAVVQMDFVAESRSEALAYEGLGVEFGVVANYHHMGAERPGGGWFSLVGLNVDLDAFPTSFAEACEDAPGQPASIGDSMVVEAEADGTIVTTHTLSDILDTNRLGFDALTLYRDNHDWSHVNGVFYDAQDDALVVSLRNQDTVVKIDRETGALVWILANHDDWAPELQPYLLEPVGEPFYWNFHQHAPLVTKDGRLLLFDNGNFRSTPCGADYWPGGANVSRVVEYEIDEEAMTVAQTWEWMDTPTGTLFSSAMGDVEELAETGNILVDFAYLTAENNGGNVEAGRGVYSSHFFEVDRDGEVVWDLNLYSDGSPPTGWYSYRVHRFPTFYATGAVETR